MVTQNMLLTQKGIQVYSQKKKNIRFGAALDLIKCLKQIKYQRLLLTHQKIPIFIHMCATCSELPSNTTTMYNSLLWIPKKQSTRSKSPVVYVFRSQSSHGHNLSYISNSYSTLIARRIQRGTEYPNYTTTRSKSSVAYVYR